VKNTTNDLLFEIAKNTASTKKCIRRMEVVLIVYVNLLLLGIFFGFVFGIAELRQ